MYLFSTFTDTSIQPLKSLRDEKGTKMYFGCLPASCILTATLYLRRFLCSKCTDLC